MSTATADVSAFSPPPARRSAPRVEILGLLHGSIVSMNLSFHIVHLDGKGFTVESPIPFPRGAVHEFRLTGLDGTPVHARARVLSCREAQGRTLPYAVDFAFRQAPGVSATDRPIGTGSSVLEFP